MSHLAIVSALRATRRAPSGGAVPVSIDVLTEPLVVPSVMPMPK